MLGCSTICPNCKHQFQCCPTPQTVPNPKSCCSLRRSLHVLSGGGLITTTTTTTTTLQESSSCVVSPSIPLTFVLPPPPMMLMVMDNPIVNQENELEGLSNTVRVLRLSGWYYENLTYEHSNDLLKNTRVGTFLVRNSSDRRFLFSLSVQTDRGPTSIRLCFSNGLFRLDAQTHLQAAMPLFPNVLDLVQYYVKRSKLCMNDNNAQVWVDPQGKWYSPILLEQPLRKDCQPPSLKHLARLTVHRTLQSVKNTDKTLHTQLELPTSLMNYLNEYPYCL